MIKTIIILIMIFAFTLATFAQVEKLTNKEIILMTQAGLSKDLIKRKIKETKGFYDTSAEHLITLKKAGVSDEVIKLMMDADKVAIVQEKEFSESQPTTIDNFYKTPADVEKSRIVLEPKEALLSAKTIAIKKSSLHPSRQALEKELLKRDEWKALNLNIVRYKDDADLLIEIGYVSMSWITHRYVYRIYDNKSGTIIIAGETTSWGDLSKNLARGISKRLSKIIKNN